MAKLEYRQERYLWFWERKRFAKIKNLIETTTIQSESKISPHVARILFSGLGEYMYKMGEGGTHLWIHRKRSHKRLSIIIRLGSL